MFKYSYQPLNGVEYSFTPFDDITFLNVDGITGHGISLKTSKGTNQIGDSITHAGVEGRPISVDGVIHNNIEFSRKQLISIFAPQSQGTLYVNDGNERYKIDVYVKQTPIIGFGAGYQKFQLTLYADYPYFTIDKEKKHDIRALIPLLRFPCNFAGTWKLSEYQRSEFINVRNDGNSDTPIKMVLTAKAVASNFTITNVTTNERIKLDYEMQPNETITITTGYNNKRVMSNINGNIFSELDHFHTTFLQLKAGDNVFKFDAEVNENNVEVVIYANEVVTDV